MKTKQVYDPQPDVNGSDPFPTDMLPERLQAMVKSVAGVFRVPDVMPAVIALTMVAAAIGKGLRIASGRDRKTMANLFTLISAESGTGKSSVLCVLRRPLDILQDHFQQFGRQQGLDKLGRLTSKSRRRGFEDFDGFEGSIDLMLSRPKKTAKIPKPRMICSDVTGQKLARLLGENQETILNTTAEAGDLIDEISKATSPLKQILLKGFSGDSVEIDRVTLDEVVMKEPCLSVCWLCQPHRLDRLLSNDRLLEDGLLPRFLVAHSGASMMPMSDDAASVPAEDSDAYEALIEELFVLYGRNSTDEWVVENSKDAWEVMRNHGNRCVERWRTDAGPMRPCIARRMEQSWKIALVLHAATHGKNSHEVMLEQDTARRAVALQDWFARQQMRILDQVVPSPKMTRFEKLSELLRGSPDGEQTLRNLQNSHGFYDTEVRSLVESAPQQLHLQKRKNPGGGRPSWVVGLLNP